MSSTKFPITQAGLEGLQEEVKRLKEIERPTVIDEIARARELGDLSENAEYHAAREKQSFIEAKIAELESKLSRAEVIQTNNINSNKIQFGAVVSIQDIDTDVKNTYQIVGDYEADLANNMISVFSPLARALIGKTKGDEIEFSTPSGASKEYVILDVVYNK